MSTPSLQSDLRKRLLDMAEDDLRFRATDIQDMRAARQWGAMSWLDWRIADLINSPPGVIAGLEDNLSICDPSLKRILNEWMARQEKRRGTLALKTTTGRSVLVEPQNQEAILRVLAAAGIDPLALGPGKGGRNGDPSKQAAKKALVPASLTDSAFEKAWSALLEDGRLVRVKPQTNRPK